jgi:dGTPase
MNGVTIKSVSSCPALSRIEIDPDVHRRVCVLKYLVYYSIIESNRLRIVSTRADYIVNKIFDELEKGDGWRLLPNDFHDKWQQAGSQLAGAALRQAQMRIICDFIAGMTDKYAVEFYSRLYSENYQTIFREY